MRVLWSSAIAALVLSGCITTKEEGKQLRSDVEVVREQVAQIKRAQDAERARLEEKVAGLSSRVRELEGTLRSLRQADADGGVQMEKVIAEVQFLRGELEEARFQIGETKKSVKDILARPPVEVAAAELAPKVDEEKIKEIGGKAIPEDAKGHFALIESFYKAKRLEEALQSADTFLAAHKADANVVKAQMLRGEILFDAASAAEEKKVKERAYRQAILAYQKVLESNKSKDVDDAMFKIGLSFERLGFLDNAVVFYETLLKEHPKSNKRRDAKKRLSAVKKQLKKKSKKR